MSLKDFQILQELGEGAYSRVFKIKRIADQQEYALKKVNLQSLSDKEKQNALNEVRILASVRHANVIQYKEAFLEEQSQALCIVMEYADDGDLYQKIVECQKKGVLMSENDILIIFIQIVKGLKALHDMKIYHRDLKSANVFMNTDGTVKLGDMNVSKVARKILLYTQTGTPYYASPEVWKDQPYDSKSDIWSLGCVLYEMTTLKPPFRAEDMSGLYKKVVKGFYPKIPTIYSQDLSNVIRALLQVQPHLRPSCDKILQLQSIVNRLDDKVLVEEEGAKFLLQTIRVPRNMHYLTDRLPKPNYNPIRMTKIDKQQFIQTLAIQKLNQENLEENHSMHVDFLPRLNKRNEESLDNSVVSRNNKKGGEDNQLDNPKNNQINQIYGVGIHPRKKDQRISNKSQKHEPLKSNKKNDLEGELKPLIIKSYSPKIANDDRQPLLPLLPSIKKDVAKQNEDEQLKKIRQTEELIQQLRERQLKHKKIQKL
ncbi:unnamed protein product [Paramecium octaurelia]|uniref:non-specific serine/threonine protein kinase n=1 Tax=Paramecium octaurelia TaxID=43137 RepID=A0A8S1VVL1_PAROT|nr:unnamed protein product [Paramecium octaurelia]